MDATPASALAQLLRHRADLPRRVDEASARTPDIRGRAALLAAMGAESGDARAAEAPSPPRAARHGSASCRAITSCARAQLAGGVRIRLRRSPVGTLVWRLAEESGDGPRRALRCRESRVTGERGGGHQVRAGAAATALPTGYHRLRCSSGETLLGSGDRRRGARALLPAAPPSPPAGRVVGPAVQLYGAALARNCGHRRLHAICAAASRSGASAARRSSASTRCTRCSRAIPATRVRTARRAGCSSTRSMSTSRRSADFGRARGARTAACASAGARNAPRCAPRSYVDYRARRERQARDVSRRCTRTSARCHLAAPRHARARSPLPRGTRRLASRATTRCTRHLPIAHGAQPVAASGPRSTAIRPARPCAASATSTRSASSSSNTCNGRRDLQLAAHAGALRRARAWRSACTPTSLSSIGPDGSEAWANQRLYALGRGRRCAARRVQPAGQDWGLPPLMPDRLREAGYAPVDRHAAREHAARGRAAHRPRDGPDAPVLDAAGIDAGATVPTCATRSMTCSACSRSRATRNRCLVDRRGPGHGARRSARRAGAARNPVVSRAVLFEHADDGELQRRRRRIRARRWSPVSTHDLPTLAGLVAGRRPATRATRSTCFPGGEQRGAPVRAARATSARASA